jgi:hypothetical protein
MTNLKLQLVIAVLLSMFAQAQTSTGSSGSESAVAQVPAVTHNTWTTGEDMAVPTQAAQTQTETVLYSFANSPDGANPRYVAPVLDGKGNLYGTTNYGGATATARCLS